MKRPVEPNQEADSGETPSERATANWTKIVGVFTGLLFATSAFSDYVIWRELRDSERTQQFVEEQQRAYIGIGKVGQVASARDAQGKPSIGFIGHWDNSGGTRTKWASTWASIQFFRDAVPFNFDTSKPNISLAAPVKGIVPPNGSIETGTVGIAHDDAALAEAGKGTLLIWGEAQYADLYSPDVVHRSHFCFRLTPNGSMMNMATKEISTTFSAQPYRNDCNYVQ